MEIRTEDGRIQVFHNGERVSVIITRSRLKDIPTLSIFNNNLIFFAIDDDGKFIFT